MRLPVRIVAVVLFLAVAATARGASGLSFTQASYPIPGTSSDSFAGVAIGDLDNQTRQDIAVPQSYATAQVWVLLNNGDGTFKNANPTAGGSCPGAFAVPLIAQFTGDTNRDLMQSCADGVQIELLPGDGQGGLGAPSYYTLSLAYYGLIGNLDGRRDLIYPALAGAPGGPWRMCFIALADLGAGPLSPTCSTDLIPHGDFIVTNIFAPGANPPYDRDQVIGVADVNNIFFIGYDAQGPGGWSYATRYVGAGSAREVAAGDLNGDGINDIVVANDGSLSVFVAHPTTGGIDVGAQGTPGGSSLEIPYYMQLADFDGNGQLDAIVGGTDSQNNPEFAIMLGHGNGTFDPPVRFSTGFDPNSTAWWMGIGDLNGDGKADVVIVNGDERTVRVFLNGTTSVSTTTTSVSTTTTTLPSALCQSIVTCLAALKADLPTPAGAASKKLRRLAVQLASRYKDLSKVIAHAAGSAGKKRTRLFAKSRADLHALVKAAVKAAARGTLGVPLPPLQAAANALLGQIP